MHFWDPSSNHVVSKTFIMNSVIQRLKCIWNISHIAGQGATPATYAVLRQFLSHEWQTV